MNFAQVLEALKEGKRARRYDWNTGTFIFMQVPSVIPKDIVPKMQSLPQSVKDEFERRFDEHFNCIYYRDQLALVNAGNVITGYSPSISDCLAGDWHIMD